MERERLVLQTRDYLLLQYLCEFGYLTFNQIAEKVLRCHKKRSLRRLKKLRDHQLVNLVWRRDSIGSRVYIPNIGNLVGLVGDAVLERAHSSRSCLAYFKEAGRHEDIVRNVGLGFWEHKSITRIDLEHHLLGPTRPNGFLKKAASLKVPDLVIYVGDQFFFSIEIELTQKAKMRYLKIFKDLNESDFRSVLYIVDSPAIGHAVLSAYKEVEAYLHHAGRCGLPKLKICLLKDLETDWILNSIFDQIVNQDQPKTLLVGEVNPEELDLRQNRHENLKGA